MTLDTNPDLLPLCQHPAFSKLKVPIRLNNGAVACRNLSLQENNRVIDIVGKGRRIIACTIGQLFWTEPSKPSEWMRVNTGVLCYVKDSIAQSYFIIMIDRNIVFWEQEIYQQFKIKAPKKAFFTFEGDFCRVGLNICDMEEARWFKDRIRRRIQFLKVKNEEKKLKKVLHQKEVELSHLATIENEEYVLKLLKQTDDCRAEKEEDCEKEDHKDSRTNLDTRSQEISVQVLLGKESDEPMTDAECQLKTSVSSKTKVSNCFSWIGCFGDRSNEQRQENNDCYMAPHSPELIFTNHEFLVDDASNKDKLSTNGGAIDEMEAQTILHQPNSLSDQTPTCSTEVISIRAEESIVLHISSHHHGDEERRQSFVLELPPGCSRNRRTSSVDAINLLPRIENLRASHSSSIFDRGSSHKHPVVLANREDLMKSLLEGIQLKKVTTDVPLQMNKQNADGLGDILARALEIRKQAMRDKSDEEWDSVDDDDSWDDDAGDNWN